MGATNLPDILDPALTRPGRFDRHVSFLILHAMLHIDISYQCFTYYIREPEDVSQKISTHGQLIHSEGIIIGNSPDHVTSQVDSDILGKKTITMFILFQVCSIVYQTSCTNHLSIYLVLVFGSKGSEDLASVVILLVEQFGLACLLHVNLKLSPIWSLP